MAENISSEGVKLIPLGGMNEQVLPEYGQDDFTFLQGFTSNRQGELIRIPGKRKITRLGNSPILGFVQFGDTVFVETDTQIIRFSNSELFGGIDSSPNPQPDHYQASLSEEEEILNMSQVILKYRVAGNTAASSVSASTWTRVPFNHEDRDSGGNCVLDGSGNFTLTATTYPTNVRIKGAVSFTTTIAGIEAVGQLLLETNTGFLGLGGFVLSGMNACTARTSSARYTGNLEINGSLVLAASTQYRLVMFMTGAGAMGVKVNTTLTEEVYGHLELLFEPAIVPVVDGTVTPVTTITTASGIVTAVA